MTEKIKAYAAHEPKGKFEPFEYDPGELRPEQVEIKVTHGGICHSDMSMRDNEWGMTEFPFVGGHESVGEIVALGGNTKGLAVGDRVGLGWNAGCCMHCDQCVSGYQINCPELEQTIVSRFGGFADRVRCNWEWAEKLPDALDPAKAGPLFCGGITVFNPFVQNEIKPTDKVGVVGIGGLGHMAIQFADKWGCEVTAFTSSRGKADDALKMGADFVVDTHSEDELAAVAGKFDMILTTANASLNWPAYLAALAPKGKLHVVGAVMDPIPVVAFNLIMGQKSVTGTATGSPDVVRKMLEFCARHNIEAVTEHYPMSRINDAFDHLASGKARYRIVLENDLS
jgi:alcohol/geraniol dehydrogenase (NADP+)